MQTSLKSIALFCGSNSGSDPDFAAMAEALATTLAIAGITLVYGGAKVGLMGVAANKMMQLGGKVIGVMPKSLAEHEIAHEHLSELHIVGSMHERKALIEKLSDGFIMLPGGPGTLEEFFEAITWAKLGYHKKPCGILNVNGYYDLIIRFIDQSVNAGFLHASYRDMIAIEDAPERLLRRFHDYQAPLAASAWL